MMLGLLSKQRNSLTFLNSSLQSFCFKGSHIKFSSLITKRSSLLIKCHNAPINGLRKALERQTETFAGKVLRNHPDGNPKAVGLWLLGCGGMVFTAVVLGGVTRLTESGLSMVTWKLLGEKLPTTESEWAEEFEKYQQFPEFKTKNSSMTLNEFKWIWWMEFAHRSWGRLIGGAFLLPAIYFWSKGYFNRALKIRVSAFGGLIAAQGLMGWYMVRSGLERKFEGPNEVARVSQYRLASHLGLAFVLYTGFLWSALDCLVPADSLSKVTHSARKFRALAHSCKGMIFLTAISGAFVAGLDAGLYYNSFPKMGDQWIPDDIASMTPKIKNITENPVTVQFNHRILGTITLGMVSALWLFSRKQFLPRRAYLATHAITVAAWAQVILGITTLLHYVPVSLGAMHQSGSLILLSMAVWLTHELKHVKRFVK